MSCHAYSEPIITATRRVGREETDVPIAARHSQFGRETIPGLARRVRCHWHIRLIYKTGLGLDTGLLSILVRGARGLVILSEGHRDRYVRWLRLLWIVS